MIKFFTDFKAWFYSLVINMAIFYIWFGLEFIQFGTLQWDRQCDEAVGLIYYVTIAWLIHKSNK